MSKLFCFVAGMAFVIIMGSSFLDNVSGPIGLYRTYPAASVKNIEDIEDGTIPLKVDVSENCLMLSMAAQNQHEEWVIIKCEEGGYVKMERDLVKKIDAIYEKIVGEK